MLYEVTGTIFDPTDAFDQESSDDDAPILKKHDRSSSDSSDNDTSQRSKDIPLLAVSTGK